MTVNVVYCYTSYSTNTYVLLYMACITVYVLCIVVCLPAGGIMGKMSSIWYYSCVLRFVYLQVRVMGKMSAQVSSIAPQHSSGLFAIWSAACRSCARTRRSITDRYNDQFIPGELNRTQPNRSDSDRAAQHTPHQPLKHTSHFRLTGGEGRGHGEGASQNYTHKRAAVFHFIKTALLRKLH